MVSFSGGFRVKFLVRTHDARAENQKKNGELTRKN